MGDKTYVNTTDSQVVVNAKGAILAGGTRGDLKETKQVKKAVKAGLLLEVESERKGSEENPDANKGEASTEGGNAEGTTGPTIAPSGAVDSDNANKRQER